jgi:hypothetical protein
VLLRQCPSCSADSSCGRRSGSCRDAVRHLCLDASYWQSLEMSGLEDV